MRLLPRRREPTLRERAERAPEALERVAKLAVERSRPAFEEARRQVERASPLVERARKEAESRTKGTRKEVEKRAKAARKELDKRTKDARKELDKRTKGPRKEARKRTKAARKRLDPAVERVRSRLPGHEPSRLERAKAPLLLAGAAAAGGAAVYFFDPAKGKARRAKAKDRTASALRATGRTAGTIAARLRNRAKGAAHDAIPSGGGTEVNGPTLAHKVESEVLGDPEFPKDRVNVSAENGTVVLKGDLDDPEQVRRLEEAVRRVDGVRDVDNRISTGS